MIKKILLLTFLLALLHASGQAQSVAEMLRKFRLEAKRETKGCKVKSDYKSKRNSIWAQLGFKKKKSKIPPHPYVYKSKNSAPPASPPTPQQGPLVASSTPLNTQKDILTPASPSPSPEKTNTTPTPEAKSTGPGMKNLKDMPPDQRKKEVLDLPPTRQLPPIRFITDQDEFSVVNMDSFMEALELVKQGKMLLIEGHTDDLGSDTYNLKLSMKRVEKIRQLLISAGGDDNLISVIGYGEKKPIVPNTNAENRQINRRIEFKIFDLDQ